MTRVHDMGGRFGDGPVRPGDDAVYAEEWHGRALALTLAAGALGQWNIDRSRHAREELAPKDYARLSYYEKWLAALADLLVETGVISREELADGRGRGRSYLAERVLEAGRVRPVLDAGSPYERAAQSPQFAVGDRVRTRRPAGNAMVEGGHTRLPSYAAGAEGEVIVCHGGHVFPDASAHGFGEAPEPLYGVRFSARALWGEGGDARDEVMIDLWQSYLERA